MASENVENLSNDEAQIKSRLDEKIESARITKRLILNNEKFNSQLEDRHIDYIVSSLPHLKALSLSGCLKITDRCIDYLVNLNDLICLDLSYCPQISDVGIEKLSVLTSLHSLIIGGSSDCVFPHGDITDKMLENLSKITSLEYLELLDGVYSDRSFKNLEMLLPNCNVVSTKR